MRSGGCSGRFKPRPLERLLHSMVVRARPNNLKDLSLWAVLLVKGVNQATRAGATGMKPPLLENKYMHAIEITPAGLARPRVGPRAGVSEEHVVRGPTRPDTSAPTRATALRTPSCLRERRLGLSRNRAKTMDAAEQWVYAVLWLCCLFSLVYCFATLF